MKRERPIQSGVPHHLLAWVELAPEARCTGVKERMLRQEAPLGYSCPLSYQPWG